MIIYKKIIKYKNIAKEKYERGLINMKKIFLKIALVSIILGSIVLSCTGCEFNAENKEENKQANNPYGFTSEYSENTVEKYQLKNFPEVKDQMLELEKKIQENNLKIRNIKFDGWGIAGYFWLGEDENSNDYIKLDMDQDKDTNEYKLYTISFKLFDDSKYESAKKTIVSFAKISEEEAKLVDKITKDDPIQTMEYFIEYSEGTETISKRSDKIVAEGDSQGETSTKASYKELEILNHPAEDERKTNLYAVKREERKPKADGQNVDEYGLSFYIPNGLTANKYNGTLYTWEYYTGNIVGMYPEGIDIMLKVSGLREGKDADTYFRNDSRPAKSNGVSPFEIKEINGAKWYTCNNGTIYYYGAEFMGNIYEIEIKNGKVINGITLENVMNMIEKTLFFE